jgi:hypothetical protein
MIHQPAGAFPPNMQRGRQVAAASLPASSEENVTNGRSHERTGHATPELLVYSRAPRTIEMNSLVSSTPRASL